MDLHSIITLESLRQAFAKVSENKGCAGVDHVSTFSFAKQLEKKLIKLKDEVLSNQYHCQPCKVVTIPKSTGSFRQLAIPTVRDRVVQTAVSQMLVPFFEPHFEKCSFGYRPERSYLQAIRQVQRFRDKGYHWVLDADIKSYFNHIPHTLLLQEFTRYIDCPQLLSLIETSLQQMQKHKDKYTFGIAEGFGLPQGSPLSPVLANMYLDPLDEALLALNCTVVRYADDFIVLAKNDTDISKALHVAHQQLSSLGLAFNEEKTRVTDFDSGFVFLGHYFIGQLAQPIKNDQNKIALVCWQWDAPNLLNETTLDAFSGKEIKEEITSSEAQQLQSAIIEADHQPNMAQLTETEAIQSALVNKIRTLYISQQGAVIHKISGRFVVKFAGETHQQIPITQIDAIFCYGNVHLTRAVLVHAFSHGVIIVMLSQMSHWLGAISQQKLPCLNTIKKFQQISEKEKLALAQTLIQAKVQHAILLLKRKMRYLSSPEQVALSPLIKELIKYRRQIPQTNNSAQLRGFEGYAAKLYFTALKQLIAPQWGFTQRNRQPPKDPVNALLSLGYTILYNNILAMAQLRNIPINIGVLHENAKQPGLILDMMEPFRIYIVDNCVLKLLKSRGISPNDFTYENGACYLSKKAKKLFIATIEQSFARTATYHHLAVQTDFRRIIDLQLLCFKRALQEPNQSFKPFVAK